MEDKCDYRVIFLCGMSYGVVFVMIDSYNILSDLLSCISNFYNIINIRGFTKIVKSFISQIKILIKFNFISLHSYYNTVRNP